MAPTQQAAVPKPRNGPNGKRTIRSNVPVRTRADRDNRKSAQRSDQQHRRDLLPAKPKSGSCGKFLIAKAEAFHTARLTEQICDHSERNKADQRPGQRIHERWMAEQEHLANSAQRQQRIETIGKYEAPAIDDGHGKKKRKQQPAKAGCEHDREVSGRDAHLVFQSSTQ